MTDPPTTKSRDRSFDNEAFFAALDAERESRGIHWKTLASEAGVSASTLTRIGQGRRPDVDSFAALVAWARLDPDKFFRREGSGARGSTLGGISVLLRHDPNLSEAAAAAIEDVVKATYKRLRTQ